MTKHDDELNIHQDLSRLLVAMVLGDASDEQLVRLNDLLRSDIELRHRAARFLKKRRCAAPPVSNTGSSPRLSQSAAGD